jgi:hypothetical protein
LAGKAQGKAARSVGWLNANDDGVRHRRDRRYALRLPGKTSFAEEIVRSKHWRLCHLTDPKVRC